MDHPEKPTVLSFCTGYGGIEEGLHLAGVDHRVITHVEIEAYAVWNLVQKMEKGSLDPAPVFTDVKKFPADEFRGKVDILTGGYPCQPFSVAGRQKGADDPRHLWPYIHQHIQRIQPSVVFLENVEGHIERGLQQVLEDLGSAGYSPTWGIFSASEVGAPHNRRRVFIMGHSEHDGSLATEKPRSGAETSHRGSQRKDASGEPSRTGGCRDGVHLQTPSPANPNSSGLEGRQDKRVPRQNEQEPNDKQPAGCHTSDFRGWASEPNVGRVVDGAPHRVDRLRLLGNGVVPQTAALAWQVLFERFARIRK